MGQHLFFALDNVLLYKARDKLTVLFLEARFPILRLFEDEELETAEVLPGKLQTLPVQIHGQGFDAGVVDVVTFIEYYDAVFL